jgi:hypothetical protein
MDAPALDCALCGHRTLGETRLLALGYGVSIWVCAEHGSPDFQRLRRGRDFVDALERIWAANGCLTTARRRALAAHLGALAPQEAIRRRPGSHAWAALREEAERRFAGGEPPRLVIAELRDLVAGHGPSPPSERTMRRWYSERRWLTTGRTAARAWLAAPSTGAEAP